MKRHPGHAMSSISWCLQWSYTLVSQLPEMLSIRSLCRGHHHQHRSSQRCSPSGHHAVATTTSVAAPSDALHQATVPWPPPDLRDGESFSPAEQDVGFAVLPVDALVAGAEAKLPPPALLGTEWLPCGPQRPPSPHGVFVGVTVLRKQPPGQVPAVEDKGRTPSLGETLCTTQDGRSHSVSLGQRPWWLSPPQAIPCWRAAP